MIVAASLKRALAPRRLASRLAAGLAGLAMLALAACESAPGPTMPVQTIPERPVVGAPPEPVTVPVDLAERAYTPAHLRGVPLTRVGLLLPFSADSDAARREASRILRAAELALFERAGDALVLLPKDTGGTSEGAREAARSAISDGADLIIGPLFSAAAAAAGEEARSAGIPVITFTTDATIAGDGVYLLSFPPDEEVRRITEYVAGMGADRFAFIGPNTAYGQVANDAYRRTITELLGEDPQPVEAEVRLPLPEDAPEDAERRTAMRVFDRGLVATSFYDGGVSAMTEAAARLASIGVERLDPARAATMSGRNWVPSQASPFQVVLLPEGGDQLRILAPVLVYEDIDPFLVKFIGTGLWRDPALTREPALANGWFAGPDPSARARFEQVYQSVYGETPSRLAGLGYDAASLAALFASEADFSDERLTDPDGFVGVDGLFRLRPDGTIERGLAVYTIRRDGFDVLDPAPRAFDRDPFARNGETGRAGRPVDVEPDAPS
jgi:ABC-type branched-subunit amino acid transport system substrate-binding protein